MLEQCWNHSKQCRNNVTTLCCEAKQRQQQQQQQKETTTSYKKKKKKNTVVTVDRNLHFFLLLQSKATQKHLVFCNGIFRPKSPFAAYFNIQLFGKQRV